MRQTRGADRYEFANSLRGLAALSVVVSHLVIAFWVAQPIASRFSGLPEIAVTAPPIARLALLSPLNWGSFGVGLFFVISGFVIPFSLMRYKTTAFLVGRFLRIYPTLWAGAVCSVAAIAIGAWFFGGHFTFTAKELALHCLPPLRAIFYSSPLNGVIWTLEIEIVFYLVCALIAGAIQRGSLAVAVAPFALFALWVPIFVFVARAPDDYQRLAHRLQFLAIGLPFLILMFAGVALNFRQRGLIGRGGAAVWVGACLIMFSAAWATRYLDASWRNPLAGVIDLPSYFVAAGVFVAGMAAQKWFTGHPVLGFAADISYPLYIVHDVVGYVMLHVLVARGVDSTLALVLTLAFVTALSVAVHVWVETPAHRLGQTLARSISGRGRLQTAAGPISS